MDGGGPEKNTGKQANMKADFAYRALIKMGYDVVSRFLNAFGSDAEKRVDYCLSMDRAGDPNFEPPDRLAISLGSGIVALVRTSDVKFESDPDDLAVPQSR